MYKTIILNVDELWLKGKNRKQYYEKMKNHSRSILANFHEDKFVLKNDQQRLVASSETPFSEELIERLTMTPGLSTIQLTRECELDIEVAIQTVLEDLKLRTDAKTFKVKAKRVNKSFHIPSNEINRMFGGAILKNTHLKVDVHNPDLMVEVKIMSNHIFLSWEKLRAVGGLPVSSSGHVVTLISGGFDSPVASFEMSKRGCKQTFAFFYAYPYVGEEVKEKIIQICERLSKFQNGCALYIIPFGNFQNYIAKECKEEYRTLLFRKYMMDVATRLSYRVKADALLMGDALAQVSSQTLHNMSALDRACKKLVLRPLLGHNKMEIIETAQKIGTHDISVVPHDDACALFAPKHPVIKPDLEYWDEFIANHPCDELVKEAVREAEVIKFGIKGIKEK